MESLKFIECLQMSECISLKLKLYIEEGFERLIVKLKLSRVRTALTLFAYHHMSYRIISW